MGRVQQRAADPVSVTLGALALAAAAAYFALGLPLAGYSTASLVLKPLPVLALALWVRRNGSGRYARFICTGLLCSLAGDLLLLGRGPGWFLGGLAAFLLAHLAYLAAFLHKRSAWKPLVLVLCLAVTVPFLVFLLPFAGDVAVPLAGYALVLTLMLWSACIRIGRVHPRAFAAAGGAVLFVASDAVLALHRFVTPAAGLGYAVMAAYWLGQAAIAWSAGRREPALAKQ